VTKWFIQGANASEELGPYRPSELLELVRRGEVTSETLLRKDDSSWFEAAAVGGLFEAAMRPTIRYFCPQCETEVGEPPITCPKCDRDIRRAITQITENTIENQSDLTVTGKAGNSVRNWLNRKKLSRESGRD